MLGSIFKRNKTVRDDSPRILGLGLGRSFEIDALLLRLLEEQTLTGVIAPTQIIRAAGSVCLDDTTIFRFYTDDEAFLQVVARDGTSEENVTDVKLFHYYDTEDYSCESSWNDLLDKKIGVETYHVADKSFHRVWKAAGSYHKPVYMKETTFDSSLEHSETDQFVMLFERELADGGFESLMLSAEESMEETGSLSRCLVTSTGISLSASQIVIHG